MSKTTIHLTELVQLFHKYFPLIDYLEKGRGYGSIEVVTHGKRPQKAREAGPWTNFPKPELEVLVQDVSVVDILAMLNGDQPLTED